MAVYISDGKTEIGALKIPGRKKPCICVKKGNSLEVCGTFANDMLAVKFMNELIKLVKAGEGESND